MESPDPAFWQETAKWLWGVLLVPLGILWKKADNSIQKEDFRDFCSRFDEHCRQDRETQAKLFDKIDDLKTTIIERIK